VSPAWPRPRVAVTGLGVTCALGRNQREYWAESLAGRCGIGVLDLFESEGCLSRRAAQARELRPHASRREARRHSRTDLLCLAAAEEAVEQAGLAGTEGLRDFGVSLGTSTAGMLETEAYCRDVSERGVSRAPVSRVLRLPTSVPADVVARRFGAAGPRLSNMTACASSAAAIGLAADLIREGAASGMIAGGGDALCRMTYAGFNALRLVDVEPCRPFDSSRSGLSLGEGAGILVLEAWDQAVARGARPLAEFVDYGCSCDAHHMTGPHPEGRGAAAAMLQALERSGLSPQRVGHVNAHGTGTPLNDATEALALMAVFGRSFCARLPLTATKSRIGHLLGGAGGVEAVTLVLSLMHQTLPATLGWEKGDPGVDLDVVSGSPRRHDFEVGLSNGFGFGGSNCSLIFRRST
jgi:3-oxoacyl-[acyl-carrier-protein] synthase II